MSKKSDDSKLKRGGVTTIVRDAELRTPLHDEILLWLDATLGLLLGDAGSWQWDAEEVAELRANAAREISEQSRTLTAAVENSDRRKSKTGSRRLPGEEYEHAAAEFLRGEGNLRSAESASIKEAVRRKYLTDEKSFAAAQKLRRALDGLSLPDPPEYPGVIIEGKSWQVPIYEVKEGRRGHKKDGALVGFIDLVTDFRRPVLSYTIINNTLASQLAKKSYVPAVRWSLGYTEAITVYFDVRSEIPSIGGLIREVVFIRECTGDVDYIVVSPDDRFENVLRGQDVGFMKYEPGLAEQLPEGQRYLAQTAPGDVDWRFRYGQSGGDGGGDRFVEAFDEIEAFEPLELLPRVPRR